MTLNGETLKTFPLKSGARQGQPLLFKIILSALPKARERNKKDRCRKGASQSSLYFSDPNDATRDLINTQQSTKIHNHQLPPKSTQQ